MTKPDPPRSSRDYHEPMPDLAAIPAWLWRRSGIVAKLAVGSCLLAVVATAVILLPHLQETNRERRLALARERQAQRAQLARSLAREQRPILGRLRPVDSSSDPRAERLAVRRAMVRKVSLAVQRDAGARVRAGELDGPIRGGVCEPFPRTVGDDVAPDQDLTKGNARYSCVAVTARFRQSDNSVGGILGHQYRVRLDFRTGRFGFCKITGRAGPEREQIVTIPRSCGGE